MFIAATELVLESDNFAEAGSAKFHPLILGVQAGAG
jgi:hypothetical protein